jgi:hypothetical protein
LNLFDIAISEGHAWSPKKFPTQIVNIRLLINAIKEFKLRPFIIIFVLSVTNVFATKTQTQVERFRVQRSTFRVFGHWLLAAGFLQLIPRFLPEARDQQPAALFFYL